MRFLPAALALLFLCVAAESVEAQQPQGRSGRAKLRGRARPKASQTVVDRVVVRWHSRPTGGEKKPQFITARELAFEARLEALAEGAREDLDYADKHVRSAIQRHIAETMLSRLPVSRRPTPRQVATYAEQARTLLLQRIAEGEQGESEDARYGLAIARLEAARLAEDISREELDAILRRRARASWYLDKMVAPMLKPSELDLREVHRQGDTPFTDRPFDEVHEALERWYVSTRLATALDRYFRNTRDRVKVYLVDRRRRGR